MEIIQVSNYGDNSSIVHSWNKVYDLQIQEYLFPRLDQFVEKYNSRSGQGADDRVERRIATFFRRFANVSQVSHAFLDLFSIMLLAFDVSHVSQAYLDYFSIQSNL